MKSNSLTISSLVIIAILALCALVAPWLAPRDPAAQELSRRLESPSTRNFFGMDELGRDELSRLIFGARISVQVGLSVVAVSLLVGLVIGSIAGYYGGVPERVINLVVINSLQAFPGILLALAIVAFIGPGLEKLIF